MNTAHRVVISTITAAITVAFALPGQDRATGAPQSKQAKPAAAKVRVFESPSGELLADVMATARDEITTHLNFGESYSQVFTAWSSGKVDAVEVVADQLIGADEKSFLGHALKYFAHIELGRDRVGANKVVGKAIKALREHPKSLATFFNRAVFVHGSIGDYQTALMTLVPMVADARGVGEVRVAHLRALLGCKKAKEALVTNKKIVEDLKADKAALLEVARAICESAHGAALAPLAREAIEAVRKSVPATKRIKQFFSGAVDGSPIHLYRYLLLRDLEKNQKGATAIGRKLVASQGGGATSINNWVWYLMTRRASEGKYSTLALMGAKEMMKDEDIIGGQLDTVALAYFMVGDLDNALDLQTKAVAAGGSAGLTERLALFKNAVAARDAKPKKQPESKPTRK